MTRPAPPGGASPPTQAFTSEGAPVDLRPFAQEICRRYQSEFPDEAERYGPAGSDWCLHDNLYLLAWAIQDGRDSTVVLSDQVLWLGRVLAARDFPMPRLIRDLEIAGEVILDGAALGDLATLAAEALNAAARLLAEREQTSSR
jgi:hypothetical protein